MGSNQPRAAAIGRADRGRGAGGVTIKRGGRVASISGARVSGDAGRENGRPRGYRPLAIGISLCSSKREPLAGGRRKFGKWAASMSKAPDIPNRVFQPTRFPTLSIRCVRFLERSDAAELFDAATRERIGTIIARAARSQLRAFLSLIRRNGAGAGSKADD